MVGGRVVLVAGERELVGEAVGVAAAVVLDAVD